MDHGSDRNAPWALTTAELFAHLGSGAAGLSTAEATDRRARAGPNSLETGTAASWLRVLFNQVRSPLLLLLLFAAVVSALTGAWVDAGIVFTIAGATVLVGFRREYAAQRAAQALQARVRTQARVVRGGDLVAIAVEDVVVGDVVDLAAGSLVPADAVVIAASDCYVSAAALTGESFPVAKRPGVVPAATALAQRTNMVHLGTNVRSGSARALVVATGARTEIGGIARRITARPPETEFDRGVRRFGYLLTTAMLAIVLLVFVAHVLRGRPPIETLLFSIALAVGLSPELLPAILSVNLARGAQGMAKHGVLVRRLNAIENLGSMDLLCTDKTGTLTVGVIEVAGSYDPQGNPDAAVLALAATNATLATGLRNPLDDAIAAAVTDDSRQPAKLGEIPFDFVRKRVSVAIDAPDGPQLVTKGAFAHVLEICTTTADGRPLDDAARAGIEAHHRRWSSDGVRVIAVARGPLDARRVPTRADEQGLAFVGFVTLLDRPKDGVAQAITDLARLGVGVKVITGDSMLVARHVATTVGIVVEHGITGAELDEIHADALPLVAESAQVFAEVDPNQKQRIIAALRQRGHVVGFLGDGINDAPAMHEADTSISVQSAVDVAREAADFVLLERDLDVIRRGIAWGRRTFANTSKYVLTTTSANLGNMVSMAAASLFLPFLPLLAGQILLNNFLSDIPALGIADDGVDDELVARPRRWDLGFIARFMIEFGLLSSAFDALTFAVLLGALGGTPELFRTGWFVESLLTELVIALVVRTRRPFFRSRPGSLLLVSTAVLIPLAFAIPYLPGAAWLGFVPLPAGIALALVGITLAYVAAAELLKRWFYRHAG